MTKNWPDIPDCWPSAGNRFSAWLGRTVFTLLGWKLDGKLPDNPKLMLVVAPHTSNIDFLLGIWAKFGLASKIHWMAKHTMFNNPLGRFFIRIGGIPVDRSAPGGIVEGMAKRFRDSESLLVVIAPEGTRSPVDHWKNGFCALSKLPTSIFCR